MTAARRGRSAAQDARICFQPLREEENGRQARAAAHRSSSTRLLDGLRKRREPMPEEKARDTLLVEFEALAHPDIAPADGLIEGLRPLPSGVVDWCWVLTVIARQPQLDLAAAYRRIAPLLPGRAAADFYWKAAHRLSATGLRSMLPEVAERFRQSASNSGIRPPCASWRITCSGHIWTRRPCSSRSESSLQWRPLMVQCVRILHLRVGRLLCQRPADSMSQEAVSRYLWRDLSEEDREPRLIERIVDAVWQPAPQAPWRREDFPLCAGNTDEDEEDRAQVRHLHATLAHVAREAWTQERFPPGSALRAVNEVLAIACDERARRGRRQVRTGDNLLDYLAVAGMDERIGRNCLEQGTINLARARLTIEGHELLLRFAQRHGLLPAAETTATAAELARLSALADLRMREDGASCARD